MLFSWFFTLVMKFQTGNLHVKSCGEKEKGILLEYSQMLMFIKDKSPAISIIINCQWTEHMTGRRICPFISCD